MFVNKINNQSFKGYQLLVDDIGDRAFKFYHAHDSESQDVKIEFYKKGVKGGDKLCKTINLKSGDTVKYDELMQYTADGQGYYKLYVNGKQVKDAGQVIDGYNVINLNATVPMNRGQSILTMVDIHRPGAYYTNDGRIEYDSKRQKYSEGVMRTYSNSGGGTLAGIEYDLDSLKEQGKNLVLTPIWGGDNRFGHHYCNKNDMQIADTIGNVENYTTFLKKLFKNGMYYTDDIAITSEGLEGIHVQYALRWANQNPQTYYWFRMNGLENGPLSFGVVPVHDKNLRHRVINPDVIYNPSTHNIEKNPDYNPHKETYFEIYDASQVTEEQLAKKDEPIGIYQNTKSDNKLLINSSEDTLVPYAFEIKPQEYRRQLEEFVKLNKNSKFPMELNSPEGTMLIGQFTNFKISKLAEGAVFWDANKDLFKRRYYISGYDEKLINAIPDVNERDNVREHIKRACYEVQDIGIQAGVYRTQFVKDVQTLYTAQVLKDIKDEKELEKLYGTVLPEEARLGKEAIENIVDIENCCYNLEPKLEDSKDDITLKALMKLPLDSLELGENTVGVLSTSFFTNRAVNEEQIGLSRYEFYKNGEGVYFPYNKTYHSMDGLFETRIKDFADEVISEVNESSPEKLIDGAGNYTEYGEYVIDLLGKDIAKYALLKAFAGDKLEAKFMPDDVLKGKITYNYSELKKATTLKALGIIGNCPEDEAKKLLHVIENGLINLDPDDVKFVAKSISKQIEGTTLTGFRLAEAMVQKAGLGIGFRLDASKDIADMDAVRSGDMTFDDAWDQVIDFWKKYVNAIKKVNSNVYIVAEITDVEKLLRSIYGSETHVWENADLRKFGGKYKNFDDAITKFFEETGITSEAGYAYTFTDLLHVFSADGENGNIVENGLELYKQRIQKLIENNSLDYIRNLLTFADNQDKPSILHVMALDMELFHTKDLEADFRTNLDAYKNDSYEIRKKNARIAILKELTNADCFEDLPLEAMMNIENKEYFKTANPRAAAMSQLIRNSLNHSNLDESTKNALKQALVDLTNGNYLSKDSNLNIETINIPELKTLEGALDKILSKTNLELSEEQKKAIVKNAKKQERVEKFAIRGDFGWNDGTHWAAREMQDKAKSVLANGEFIFAGYSPYTVSVAALLLDSYKETFNTQDVAEFVNGTREFVHEYTRTRVEENSLKLPVTENAQKTINKNTYAACDIEDVIEMLIQQAELGLGKELSQSQKDLIMKELFTKSSEAAVEKALMYATFLAASPGIPSQFYRDILGSFGYEEPEKNIYLKNRNTVKYSELETDGPLHAIRAKIFNGFQKVLKIRSIKGLEALNNGDPYMLETNVPETMAMLFHDSEDNAAITVMNAVGLNKHSIDNDNPIPSAKDIELKDILLPAGIALPVGTVFMNAVNENDGAKYLIQKLQDGMYHLIREGGGNIALNKDTTTHGAMFLKRISKVAFRGKNINKQYHIVSNPYQSVNKTNLGKNLSIISEVD